MNRKLFFAVGAILLALLVFVFVLAFERGAENTADTDTVSTHESASLVINERCVELDIAATPEARQQGLSGRAELGENKGMLFLFSSADHHSFWMKDMNFPIDIIWLDERNEVIDIKEHAQPESYPETFTPAKSATKVVELTAGFAVEEEIKIGQQLNIELSENASSSNCGLFSSS